MLMQKHYKMEEDFYCYIYACMYLYVSILYIYIYIYEELDAKGLKLKYEILYKER